MRTALRAALGGLFFCLAGVQSHAGGLPPGVTEQWTMYGKAFADANGLTLYVARNDTTPGASICYKECTEEWPPVIVPADVEVSEPWSAFTRVGGERQLAYRGKPLYKSVRDARAGDANGLFFAARGAGGPFTLAETPFPAPVGIITSHVGRDLVLVNARKAALYVYEGDTQKPAKVCDQACQTIWKPVLAHALARAFDEWTLVSRPDGTRQWAFQGKPIYTYTGDRAPGDARGVNVDPAWRLAVVREAQPMPQGLAVHHSTFGPVFSTQDGRTVYVLFCQDREGGAVPLSCDREGDVTPEGRGWAAWGLCGNRCPELWPPKRRNASGL